MKDHSAMFEQQEARLSAWRQQRGRRDPARPTSDDVVFGFLADAPAPAFPERFTSALVARLAARRRSAIRLQASLLAVGGLAIGACFAVALPLVDAAALAARVAAQADAHRLACVALLLVLAGLGLFDPRLQPAPHAPYPLSRSGGGPPRTSDKDSLDEDRVAAAFDRPAGRHRHRRRDDT